jgi:hypothetical protein
MRTRSPCLDILCHSTGVLFNNTVRVWYCIYSRGWQAGQLFCVDYYIMHPLFNRPIDWV